MLWIYWLVKKKQSLETYIVYIYDKLKLKTVYSTKHKYSPFVCFNFDGFYGITITK